jgi:excisionase family DNA binding protein
MTDLTIREASRLIGRTPATLRRYIRSGRLPAAKEEGKFGEEYRIRREDLLALGFTPAEPGEASAEALVRSEPAPAACVPQDVVPLSLYNELLMKHEQILVQYGMIRAGGQKLLEFKADSEAKSEEIRHHQERYQALRLRALKEIGLLRKRLREAEIALEERRIETAVLEERLRRREAAPPPERPALHELLLEHDRPAASASPAAAASAASSAWVAGFPPLDRKDDH